MDRVVEALPETPVTQADVQALSDHDAFDWGAAPATTTDGRVYVFLLVSPETAYGLGFHEEDADWVIIHAVDRGTQGGVAELRDAITEWAQEVYPDRYHELAPDLPDVSQMDQPSHM